MKAIGLTRYLPIDDPHTRFFCDPPYWQTEGYGLPFGMEQYEQLAEVMAGLQGRAILTINDHPDMRRVFGRFQRRAVPITYTVGGMDQAKRTRELIITTW